MTSRDDALQGSINSNLVDFGTDSEARQYSSRQAKKTGSAPFIIKVKS